MKYAMKDVSTAPTAKMRMPMKSRNCENSEVIPIVRMLLDDVKPFKRLLNSNRNVVEATLNVKVNMVKPV